jgi:hypothetical protein
MFPTKENTFMLKDADNFKIQFVEEEGSVSSAKGIWSNGQTKLFPKKK